MASRTQRLIVVLGLLISVLFLWFAFSRLNPAAVWESIQRAHLLPILVGTVVYFGAIVVIAIRWGFLLRAVTDVPWSQLVPLVSIGYMGNNVYPFRSGEVLRIWLAQRNHKIPVARTTTTVLVERIFDGLTMLTFVVISLRIAPIASDAVNQVAAVAAPIFVVLLAVFFLLSAKPNLLRRVVALFSRLLPGKLRTLVTNLSEEFIAGLECLRSPADLAGAIIMSYASWLIAALGMWIVGFAFDLDVSFATMLLVTGVVNLAGLIPASPGQLGVFEFFTSTVLIASGVAETPATSYALVVHLVIWLPVTLLGFYFLVRQGLNLGAITRARAQQPI